MYRHVKGHLLRMQKFTTAIVNKSRRAANEMFAEMTGDYMGGFVGGNFFIPRIIQILYILFRLAFFCGLSLVKLRKLIAPLTRTVKFLNPPPRHTGC